MSLKSLELNSYRVIKLASIACVLLLCTFFLGKWNYIAMTKDFPPVLIEHKGTITHRYEKLEDCGGSSSSCTAYYFILDNAF